MTHTVLFTQLLAQLTELVDEMNIDLTPQQQAQLIEYIELLNKWNRTYNLTSIKDPQQMLVKHIIDSLVISPYLIDNCYIDVGTGAGLPGIPLAIAYPDKKFILLDSLGKRIRFLTQVKTQLGLNNIITVNCRVEDYQPQLNIDGVISRAFASLTDMVNWCSHLIDKNKQFFALKGIYPQEEIAALDDSVRVSAIERLTVPNLVGDRHLVILEKNQ